MKRDEMLYKLESKLESEFDDFVEFLIRNEDVGNRAYELYCKREFKDILIVVSREYEDKIIGELLLKDNLLDDLWIRFIGYDFEDTQYEAMLEIVNELKERS